MKLKLTNRTKNCTCVLLSDALPAWLSSPFSVSSSSSVTVPPLIGCRSLSFLEDEPYKREICFRRKNILLGILTLSVECGSSSFLNLRNTFFWDITLGHWVGSSYDFKDCSSFIFKQCSPSGMASDPRRTESSITPLWRPQTSLILFKSIVLFVKCQIVLHMKWQE